jgi:hypothetical protein
MLKNISFIELLKHKVARFNENQSALGGKDFHLTDAENFGECMSLYSHGHELFYSIGFEPVMEALFDSLENHLFPFDFYSEDMSDEEKEVKFKEVSYFNAHNKFFYIKTALTQLFKMYESINRISRLSDRDERNLINNQ